MTRCRDRYLSSTTFLRSKAISTTASPGFKGSLSAGLFASRPLAADIDIAVIGVAYEAVEAEIVGILLGDLAAALIKPAIDRGE